MSRSKLLCLALTVSVALVACGDDETSTDESGEATEPVASLPVVEAPPAPPPDRRPDGSLLESDDYVAGLRLPRGLREVAVNDRQHFYEGQYVAEAYRNYFGPRLQTGNVEQLPNGGARYIEATAREARGASVVMDVLISPGAGGNTTVITIDERPPVPETPPNEAEVLAAARRALEQGE